MNVFLNPAKILLEHVHLGDRNLFFHAGLFAHLKYRLQIFILVQIWDVTTIQDIVDVFKLLLPDNLGINKQERCLFVFAARHHQGLLDIFTPVVHVVSLYDFYLEQFVVGTECSKSSQTLTSRPTHAE